jgi:hypothetical protein
MLQLPLGEFSPEKAGFYYLPISSPLGRANSKREIFVPQKAARYCRAVRDLCPRSKRRRVERRTRLAIEENISTRLRIPRMASDPLRRRS